MNESSRVRISKDVHLARVIEMRLRHWRMRQQSGVPLSAAELMCSVPADELAELMLLALAQLKVRIWVDDNFSEKARP